MDTRTGNIRQGIRTSSRGFTVLELLVSIAIIAIMLALLLPAVMHAREGMRRTQCSSNLHQIGIALHHHHDVNRRLPNAWKEADDEPLFLYGWASEILPQIEGHGLFSQIEFTQAPHHLLNLQPRDQVSLPLMLCPSDITERSFLLLEDVDDDDDDDIVSTTAATGIPQELGVLPTANYLGVFGTVEADDIDEYIGPAGIPYGDGSVINDPAVRFADLCRGLSNTMIVGERTMSMVPSTWLGVDIRGEDAQCRLVGSAITSPNCRLCDECEFSSRHTGGSNFLWADGRVNLITDSIDMELYRQTAKRR